MTPVSDVHTAPTHHLATALVRLLLMHTRAPPSPSTARAPPRRPRPIQPAPRPAALAHRSASSGTPPRCVSWRSPRTTTPPCTPTAARNSAPSEETSLLLKRLHGSGSLLECHLSFVRFAPSRQNTPTAGWCAQRSAPACQYCRPLTGRCVGRLLGMRARLQRCSPAHDNHRQGKPAFNP